MTIDLGTAIGERGLCARCGERHRPLWLDEDTALCATCVARAHPGDTITFHAGVAPPLTGRQRKEERL